MIIRFVPRSLKGGPVNAMRGALVLSCVLPLQLGLLPGVETRTVHRHARRITVGPPPMDEWRRSDVHLSGRAPGLDDSSPIGFSYRRVPAEQRSSRTRR